MVKFVDLKFVITNITPKKRLTEIKNTTKSKLRVALTVNVQLHFAFDGDADAIVGNAYVRAAVGLVHLNDLQVSGRCQFEATLVGVDL